MNKQRRLIAVMMSVVLMFSMLPAAWAADPPEGWQFQAFGNGTSTTKNKVPTDHPDGSITINATGGKIAGSDEGLSFYYKHLPKDANFEIHAKALVNRLDNTGSSTNQKSFGLMLRGDIVAGSTDQTSNYVAVGGSVRDNSNTSPTALQVVYKQGRVDTTKGGSNTKINLSVLGTSMANQSFDLKIKKSGDAFELTANGVTQKLTLDNLFKINNQIYAGLYVARDAEVTFSDFDIVNDERIPRELKLDASLMKTSYFVGDTLDLTGLKVTAVYPDNQEEVLSSSDYIVTGFDNSTAGTGSVTIHFNGQSGSIPLMFQKLDVTAMDIRYKPAKTDYYPEESFDPQGLTVLAQYNGGSAWSELPGTQYKLSIPPAAATVTGSTYQFTTPGTHSVTVRSTVTTNTYTTFDVNVKNAQRTGLEIKQPPQKVNYFIGQTFDPAGLVVEAEYSDASSVRLLSSDYTLSVPDMSTAGTKWVDVKYKNAGTPNLSSTDQFAITVKTRSITGSQVTQYPKTTYKIGESFDSAGMEVKTVYDSGEMELLNASQYEIDQSAFDNSKTGVYNMVINPVNPAIPSTVLPVTVIQPRELEWKSIRFGQSTSNTNNTVTVNDDKSVIKLVALEGGGKVTGDHDGITFYYTELDARQDNFELSADIKVLAYAKDPAHDGQESFGLMARDAIGTAGDSAVFASNIAAVGGYSGGTTKQNGTQLFVRTGVTAPNGTGSQGVQSKMLDAVKPELGSTYPAANYKLTLRKTNSGFEGRINDGKAEQIFAPDMMTVQDGDKMYVGFFAARLATIEVYNYSLKVTAAQTDAPIVLPEQTPVTPDLNFTGLEKNSSTA